jgi:small subunit ribosomal protein S17e
MGRIRGDDIKSLSRELLENYPDKFGSDFQKNKEALEELKILEGKTKRFRNRVAGYIVRLARRKK